MGFTSDEGTDVSMWFWLDGSPVGFHLWYHLEPNGPGHQCGRVEASNNYMLYDSACERQMAVLCDSKNIKLSQIQPSLFKYLFKSILDGLKETPKNVVKCFIYKSLMLLL